MGNVSVLCFAASYTVALVLEIAGLWVRFGWHRLAMVVMAVAGLVAHSAYLVYHSVGSVAFLRTPELWYLVVAWVLAAFYLWVVFTSPKTAMGLFVLPLVLITIALAETASTEPFAQQRASQFWGALHGSLMTLSTVTVSVGFIAGLMYLIQSWRLKHKVPPSPEFQLPSLEWLERTNSRALSFSVVLVCGGFISGIVLSRLQHSGDSSYQLFGDPVVISLLLMLVWLIVAEVFRMIYPSARRGRKVAYLTLASFGFLALTLITFTMNDVHGRPREASAAQSQDPSAHFAPPSVASSESAADELHLVGRHKAEVLS
ncbi:cytochrome c biogenesis protein CcsA [Aeoliella sp. ICT_H6.2]|uniref:Cytochrome c biogenesis protein CcsA n=1 Tax=Aeoliella straminimaris TaxID=2954799 RepID=A0A9X2FFA3_9BACT|nr:cytochrome c biogenesis protein CcsA [Aeoliella straminimaris]MCO6045214.1 cytochrome c biogenesis protein CcsA [Aeoliella straminimaris]